MKKNIQNAKTETQQDAGKLLAQINYKLDLNRNGIFNIICSLMYSSKIKTNQFKDNVRELEALQIDLENKINELVKSMDLKFTIGGKNND